MGWESRWVMVSMLIDCLSVSDTSVRPLTARHSSNSDFWSVPANADGSNHDRLDPPSPPYWSAGSSQPCKDRSPGTRTIRPVTDPGR